MPTLHEKTIELIGKHDIDPYFTKEKCASEILAVVAEEIKKRITQLQQSGVIENVYSVEMLKTIKEVKS